MAGRAPSFLSPYIARGYDDKFFWKDPCTLGILCYNRGMKSKNDDIILALMASSPIFGLLGFLVCYNLPSWV